jgi:hypothetical protein
MNSWTVIPRTIAMMKATKPTGSLPALRSGAARFPVMKASASRRRMKM